MRKPLFIARQGARPSGLLGRLIATIMARETAAINRAVLRRLSLEPQHRVLEIGFGHGRTIEQAARLEPQATFAGLDASGDMVQLARRRLAKLLATNSVELREGNANALPWADGTFDRVYSVHTIYFMDDLARFFREVRRVLSPNGVFVLGFRTDSRQALATFPAEIYRFRNEAEVRDALTRAGLNWRSTEHIEDQVVMCAAANSAAANSKDVA